MRKHDYKKEDIDIYNIPLDDFFHFAMSIDPVVFGFDDTDLKILLIERGEEPCKGKWALPGDLVNPEEDIDHAANRILEELTGVKDVYLNQVGAFGNPDRHPLGRVVTIAYYALVDISSIELIPSSRTSTAKWWKVTELPELGFDHAEIISASMDKLQKDAKIKPIGFELLPKKFTLAQFQELYEAIYQTSLDPSNFRKKIKTFNILTDLEESETNVSHRPAKLYSFDENRYTQLQKEGFHFEIHI